MAKKTAEQLQKEFEQATEATRVAYDKLHPTFGSDEEPLAYTYEKAVKEGDKKTIARLKAKYEAAAADYEEAQNKKNLLRKELKAAETKESAAKEASTKKKSAANLYDKTLENLTAAEAGLSGYKGEEKYVQAYKAANQAYADAVAAGKSPKKPLPQPKVVIPVDELQPKTGDEKTDPAKDEVKYGELVNLLADPKNVDELKSVQQDLRDNFAYKGPADGKWSKAFQDTLQRVYTERGQLPKILQGDSLRAFILAPTVSGFGDSGTGTGGSNQYGTISNATQAKAYINSAALSLLDREATDKEVASLTKKLNAAQKANPIKNVNGMTVGGLNAEQFLIDAFKALPEYTSKKEAKLGLTGQTIQAVGMANGINFKPAQIQNYVNRVEKGEDVKVIENEIRTAASMGQPENVKKLMQAGTDLETIYAPYKRAMASSLDLPEDAITLDDKTLRAAIGPEKEMTLYEFNKAVRNDSRWKFSQEANEEVDSMINQVKRDFGFMG
jgi:hypothetical protein